MRNPTATLIELRSHYQNIVSQSELQATEARTQIEHIDALLVNVLVQAQDKPALNLSSATERRAIAPGLDSTTTPQVSAQPLPPQTAKKAKRNLKSPPQETEKTITAIAANQHLTLSLLPTYGTLNKLEAIQKVLTEQSGHVLHQDTILQLLYGDLSSEQLNEERRRMRASLYQGVSKGLWEKAAKQPSSYWIKASRSNEPETAAVTITASPKIGDVIPAAPTKVPSRGRTQVLSLPAQYEGLSKIEAVAAVLEKNPGQAMHIETIIEQLYGTLTEAELQAEKVRMKNVMSRGVQRKLWSKAKGSPSSIVFGKPNQPVPSIKTAQQKSKATAQRSAKATPQASLKQPRRKQAELVALLRKADIKI